MLPRSYSTLRSDTSRSRNSRNHRFYSPHRFSNKSRRSRLRRNTPNSNRSNYQRTRHYDHFDRNSTRRTGLERRDRNEEFEVSLEQPNDINHDINPSNICSHVKSLIERKLDVIASQHPIHVSVTISLNSEQAQHVTNRPSCSNEIITISDDEIEVIQLQKQLHDDYIDLSSDEDEEIVPIVDEDMENLSVQMSEWNPRLAYMCEDVPSVEVIPNTLDNSMQNLAISSEPTHDTDSELDRACRELLGDEMDVPVRQFTREEEEELLAG